jgi:hypothetical protein
MKKGQEKGGTYITSHIVFKEMECAAGKGKHKIIPEEGKEKHKYVCIYVAKVCGLFMCVTRQVENIKNAGKQSIRITVLYVS